MSSFGPSQVRSTSREPQRTNPDGKRKQQHREQKKDEPHTDELNPHDVIDLHTPEAATGSPGDVHKVAGTTTPGAKPGAKPDKPRLDLSA